MDFAAKINDRSIKFSKHDGLEWRNKVKCLDKNGVLNLPVRYWFLVFVQNKDGKKDQAVANQSYN